MASMGRFTRRELLASVAAPVVLRGRFRLFAQSETTYSSRAIELVLGRNFERVLGTIWESA